MKAEIEGTIKELIKSVIQFNIDIEEGNPEGRNRFIKNFIPLLKRYASFELYMKHNEFEYFLNFKREISDVFDFLFIDGNILKVAEDIFIKNDETILIGGVVVFKFSPLLGEIEAIKRNGNPLNNISDNRAGALKKLVGYNYFEEFVSKYRSFSLKKGNESEPIIGNEYLTLIFKKYKDEFKEPIDKWIERFIYPNSTPVEPIEIDKKAIKGSNRLVLLAILAAVHIPTGNKFDYNKFVFERFGIRNYQKAISDHKEKQDFIRTLKECSTILKK